MIRDGIGRHIFQLLQNQHTLEELSEATKLQYINEVLLILGVMFVRVSICFLLIRIFGLATKKQWRWTIYSILVFNVLTSISCVIIVLAQCRPLTKLWNPLIHGSCWGPKTVNAIGDYNGGKFLALFCYNEVFAYTVSSCLGILRLDARHSPYCLHVENPNECQGQNRNLCFVGNGFFVSRMFCTNGQ